MECSSALHEKIEQSALLLLNDLQKTFGKLDNETKDSVYVAIHCTLLIIAEEAIKDAQGITNAEPTSESTN